MIILSNERSNESYAINSRHPCDYRNEGSEFIHNIGKIISDHDLLLCNAKTKVGTAFVYPIYKKGKRIYVVITAGHNIFYTSPDG